MNEDIPLPRCTECGVRTVMMAKPGRTRSLRFGHPLPIPDDFEIPTCPDCGEEALMFEQTEVLDALLRAAYPTLMVPNKLSHITTNCPTCQLPVKPSRIQGHLINQSISLGGQIVSTKEAIAKVKKDGVLKLKLEAQLKDLEEQLVATNALRDA